jgi:hypothetical protein
MQTIITVLAGWLGISVALALPLGRLCARASGADQWR